MDAARWKAVEALLEQALAVPPAERDAFLDEACQTDAALRAEVDSLLHAYQRAPGFFGDLADELFAVTTTQAAPADDQRIGQTVAQYQILGKLGGGGMGVVYKARDTRLDRFVALKFLPPHLGADETAKRRLVAEAKAASALDHRHIAVIHEIGETEAGQLFIAMAFYQGETLKKKIGRGPLPVDEAVDLAMQVAEGLAKAHQRAIIHRDIKPANIIVTDEGVAKIVDFGIAKVAGSDLTRTGTTIGTVAYMSPEQTRGETVDGRTDLWSLGVVLYELLTGERPFRGEYEQSLIYAIRHDEPAPLTHLRPDLPDALGGIVACILTKEVEDRYPDAEALLDDLQVFRQDPSTVTVAPRRRAQRRRLAAGLGVVGLAAVLLGLFFLMPSPPSAAERPAIAVLPFRNLSGDADSGYFSEGVGEDILTQIAKAGDLRVLSSLTTQAYKDQTVRPREIGEALGVTALLRGSIRRDGNDVRIGCELIDTETEELIWGETYARSVDEVFNIQHDVARQVTAALNASLLPTAEAQFEEPPTGQFTAYDFYLKGRDYYDRYRQEDNEIAVGLYKQAIGVDTTFALAYAGLAEAYAQRADDYGMDAAWVDSAQALAQKAIDLDPYLAEGYYALGKTYIVTQEGARAEAAYTRALALNPNYMQAAGNLSIVYMWQGKFDEAYRWRRRAVALGPTSAVNLNGLGLIAWYLSDFEEAVAWFRQALAYQPDYVVARVWLVRTLAQAGQYEEALTESEALLEAFPDNPWSLYVVAETHLHAGDWEQAEPYLMRLHEINPDYYFGGVDLGFVYWKTGRAEEAQPLLERQRDALTQAVTQSDDFENLFLLAATHAMLGDTEAAYPFLEQAYDRGWRAYREASIHPIFEPLRGEASFQALLERMEAEVGAMRTRVAAMDE